MGRDELGPGGNEYDFPVCRHSQFRVSGKCSLSDKPLQTHEVNGGTDVAMAKGDELVQQIVRQDLSASPYSNSMPQPQSTAVESAIGSSPGPEYTSGYVF